MMNNIYHSDHKIFIGIFFFLAYRPSVIVITVTFLKNSIAKPAGKLLAMQRPKEWTKHPMCQVIVHSLEITTHHHEPWLSITHSWLNPLGLALII